MRNVLQALLAFLGNQKKLVFVSLAAWISHILLRVFLLFRNNPYGFPFVSKPDWYIFHAVCLDFIWISKALVIFLAIIGIIRIVAAKKENVLARASKTGLTIYAIFHSVILFYTYGDHEVQRFLGCHLTLGLLNTYKDASSFMMFGDYSSNDYSIPYIHFFIFALILPLTYGFYRLLQAKFKFSIKATAIAMISFYVASSLFVNVIWTGNARMTKLRPVVSLIYLELFDSSANHKLTAEDIAPYRSTYQNLWQQVEGDSLWIFPKTNEEPQHPLYRIPTETLLNSECLKLRRAEKPNFVLVFMESERGMNVGFLNPQLQPSPTPFLDSMAAHSRVWNRMHTSGLPTTGGVLTTHLGIPHHSTLAQATDLAHVTLPSFASVLTDSGYATHYFSAADPAWDNLGVWMSKWYTAQHYDRNREDDSTFIDHAISYVTDTLSKQEKPFFATIMTRSNHYPFNFAAGMTEEQKKAPLTERINYTMNYADRQIARLIRSFEGKEWFKNTYVILMADHGFPLGENGVSEMNGGGYSNATWIPFMIGGKEIETSLDTATTAQIDIAPTILELAGIAVPNIFMGHNLLRKTGTGMSLGSYPKAAAIGLDGYRLIANHPLSEGEIAGLFKEGDTRQENDISMTEKEKVKQLKELLDSLITISDYSLEKGL